jgi:hypothetical protein
MSDIPTSPQQLTPEWLSQALTASGYLDGVRVSDASHEIIGTGKMGDNARYTLSYEGECALAPATLIAKFPAADEQARAMAGAQGAYYNEVMFYRHLALGTQMRTPAIYASEISEDRTEFVLLMEDMSPAEPGSQLVGESRQHADLCLREAARLAAAYYGNTEIGDLNYVMAAARDDGGAFGQALMEQYWPEFHDRFSHGLSAQCIAFGERYAQAHAHFVSRFKGSKTLVHGDFRSENILFHGDIATTVDWQTVGESSALADVAYFMGGSVDTQNRREWEKDLVETYCQYLEQEGVALSSQDCWDQYREFAMHGLMITVLGACFTAPEERSDRMFLAMIQRHLQHCVDLDSGEFLPL